MLDSLEQQRIVQDVFAATGRMLPLDDPIVLAALFNASVMRSAGEEATKAVAKAGSDIIKDLANKVDVSKSAIQGGVEDAKSSIREAVDEATASIREAVEEAKNAARSAGKESEKASAVALAISRQSGVQQAAFVEILEAGLQKAMHKKSQSQSTPVSRALVPRWQLFMAALAGALLFGLGNFAACGFSLSWVSDASIGRQFLNALPFLDPDLKARLVADLEKLQHRR